MAVLELILTRPCASLYGLIFISLTTSHCAPQRFILYRSAVRCLYRHVHWFYSDTTPILSREKDSDKQRELKGFSQGARREYEKKIRRRHKKGFSFG